MLRFSEKIHSIRFKLIASLITVSLLIGLISVLVGGNLLYHSVIDETKNRIQQDLNVARLIYNERINAIRLALEITASSSVYTKTSLSAGSIPFSESVPELVDRLKLDFMGITDASGQVTYQYGTDDQKKRSGLNTNLLVLRVLKNHQTVAGTMLLDTQHLRKKTTNLMVGAAVPIFSEDRLVGVIYGGMALNSDIGIVDKIGETVFKNETYKNRNVGTATIFCNDIRISTNVKKPSGKRALGTAASAEVARHVLGKGEKWIGRAMVLDDWYITAYEAITDINDKRVGMLYVGVLEAKYSDVRKNGIAVFAGITVAGIFTAIVLGWFFTGRIMRPVTHLIRASSEISSGNLMPDIGPISKDDIGRLQKEFLIMIDALKEREKLQKAESETQLIQSEKQASVGKLAAGVAHEINNPLTAVLTFTHLLLRRTDLPDDVRSDLVTVTTQTERVRRIVKSLLDFSRQTTISLEPVNINHLIKDSIRLIRNQALIKDVNLDFREENNIPELTLDRNQFQSVMINLIINALDATPSGGEIKIQSRKAGINNDKGVEVKISDTGCGIPPDHMNKLFDPFFTTKKVGKGTGLGLAVTAGIIERHCGKIKVRSKPGQGTTFTIWLPCQLPESVKMTIPIRRT